MNPKDLAAQKRLPLHLVPAMGQIYAAIGCADGARKYGPYNWREKPISYMEYLGALERHIQKLKDGADIDTDSGHHHLTHLNATCAILADAYECKTLIDDRPKVKGRATEVMAEYEKKRTEQCT